MVSLPYVTHYLTSYQSIMRAITNKIGHFLVTNTTWLFLTAIVFVSYIRILTLRNPDTFETLVYLEIEKWQLYAQFIGSACLLFLPVLLFSFFRQLLKKLLNKWRFNGLWLYCFIIHAILMLHFNIDEFFPALRTQVDTPVIFGMALLIVELIIHFNDFLIGKLKIRELFKQLNIEKILLSLVLLVALYWAYATTLEENLSVIIIAFSKWFAVIFSCYAFYWLNHYLLIEQVFKHKGIFYYLLAFGGLAMLFFPIAAFFYKYVHFNTYHAPASMWIPKGERTTSFYYFPTETVWASMFYSIPIILVYQWWKQKNDIITLEKEKSASELNALKQQVNPHFLFNTLNALYALGIEEESQKTADGIAKLGTLMRYNLNDAQKEYISLNKEIDYIKKYIELQELRITSNNELRINLLQGNLDKYQIAPLLLIPFIENAFKYGISTTEQTFLKLDITIHDNCLRMELVNTIIHQKEAKSSNGIGLSNTRKRLAALYPKQYELIIEETPTEFEVHLEVHLKK